MHTRQSLQECRLAGSIFAQQRVNFARKQIQVRTIKGLDSAERFASR
jgi:hypothetical protein